MSILERLDQLEQQVSHLTSGHLLLSEAIIQLGNQQHGGLNDEEVKQLVQRLRHHDAQLRSILKPKAEGE